MSKPVSENDVFNITKEDFIFLSKYNKYEMLCFLSISISEKRKFLNIMKVKDIIFMINDDDNIKVSFVFNKGE